MFLGNGWYFRMKIPSFLVGKKTHQKLDLLWVSHSSWKLHMFCVLTHERRVYPSGVRLALLVTLCLFCLCVWKKKLVFVPCSCLLRGPVCPHLHIDPQRCVFLPSRCISIIHDASKLVKNLLRYFFYIYFPPFCLCDHSRLLHIPHKKFSCHPNAERGSEHWIFVSSCLKLIRAAVGLKTQLFLLTSEAKDTIWLHLLNNTKKIFKKRGERVTHSPFQHFEIFLIRRKSALNKN